MHFQIWFFLFLCLPFIKTFSYRGTKKFLSSRKERQMKKFVEGKILFRQVFFIFLGLQLYSFIEKFPINFNLVYFICFFCFYKFFSAISHPSPTQLTPWHIADHWRKVLRQVLQVNVQLYLLPLLDQEDWQNRLIGIQLLINYQKSRGAPVPRHNFFLQTPSSADVNADLCIGQNDVSGIIWYSVYGTVCHIEFWKKADALHFKQCHC